MIASERLLNDEHVTLQRGTQGINEAAVPWLPSDVTQFLLGRRQVTR